MPDRQKTNGIGDTAEMMKRIENAQSKELNRKSAICFGDSITWYDGHPYSWGKESGGIAVGFQSYMRAAGMTVQNEGISNATILDIRKHMLCTELKGYDFILLTSGANDSRYRIPCGTIRHKGAPFQLSTFCGCLQSCVEYAQQQNREAKIILMTPIMGWIYAPDGYEYDREKDGIVEPCYAEAILDVGKAYGLAVCDWYHNVRITLETRKTLINDPEPDRSASLNPNPLYSLHPSSEGYRIMSEALITCIEEHAL